MSFAPLNIPSLATRIGNSVANAFSGVSQEQRDLAARIQTIPALIRHTSAMIGTLDRIEARRAEMQATGQSWSDEAESAYWQFRELVTTRRNQLIVIKNRTYAAAAQALQAGRMTQRDFDAIAPMLQNGEQGSNENPAQMWQQAQAAAAGGLGVAPLVIIAAGVAIAIAAFGVAMGLSEIIRDYIGATSDANAAATEATTYWRIWEQQQTANPGAPAPGLPSRTPGVTSGSNANSGTGTSAALMLAAGVALAAGVVYLTTRPRRN